MKGWRSHELHEWGTHYIPESLAVSFFFLLGCIVFASIYAFIYQGFGIYTFLHLFTPSPFNVIGPFSRSRAGAELIRHEMWSLSMFWTRSPLRIAEVIPVTIRKLSIGFVHCFNKM